MARAHGQARVGSFREAVLENEQWQLPDLLHQQAVDLGVGGIHTERSISIVSVSDPSRRGVRSPVSANPERS